MSSLEVANLFNTLTEGHNTETIIASFPQPMREAVKVYLEPKDYRQCVKLPNLPKLAKSMLAALGTGGASIVQEGSASPVHISGLPHKAKGKQQDK